MNIEQFVEYTLTKPAAAESFPFDESTLVIKVNGKMFALASLDADPFSITLKCDPERAETLRTEYEEVRPGYHMNKKYWNTITIGDGTIPESLIKNIIDHSYDLVVATFTKKQRASYQEIIMNEQN